MPSIDPKREVFWFVDPCVSELVGDARELSPSAQEALRLRAVAALVAGRTREDVAAVFQVSLKAVDNWWAKWPAGGREALVAQPRGRRVGEHQVLDAVEQQAIRQAVLDHRPCDLGLAGQLWTRAGVGGLTEQGVGKYLRRATGCQGASARVGRAPTASRSAYTGSSWPEVGPR